MKTEAAGAETGALWLGMSGRGALPTLRWAAADVAGPLRQACAGTDLSPLAAAALGRCLAAAVLLWRMAIKTPSRLVLELAGDGPLGKVLAEVEEGGSVRGMVGSPRVELPSVPGGDLDVEQAVGSGLLRVWRLHGRTSYQSQVLLETGSVSQALTHFLRQSEQTRSAAVLGVLAIPDGIAAAGGVLVEVLPGSPADTVGKLEENIGRLESPSRRLAAEGLTGLAAAVLASFDRSVLEIRPLEYRCYCRRALIERYLQSVVPSALEELRTESGLVEAECVFCGSRYRYDPARLEDVVVN